MHVPYDAVLLRIFLGESDRCGHQPLHEAIVLRAREQHLAGATVLRGPMGFGKSSLLHTAKILRLSMDLPMVIEIVDPLDQDGTPIDPHYDLFFHGLDREYSAGDQHLAGRRGHDDPGLFGPRLDRQQHTAVLEHDLHLPTVQPFEPRAGAGLGQQADPIGDPDHRASLVDGDGSSRLDADPRDDGLGEIGSLARREQHRDLEVAPGSGFAR